MDSLLLRQHLELEERHWWFVARRKILLRVLERHLPRKTGLEILDAGCGGGATMENLGRYGRTRGVELSEVAVEYNQERGREVIVGSVEQLPYADASFDLVLALDVVEHVPDDSLALRELSRVLASGGSLLITVPALRVLWSTHDVTNGHHRRYSLGELVERIEETGLTVAHATYFNMLLFPAILAVRTFGRLRWEGDKSDLSETPRPLNALLEGLFSLEVLLAGRFCLPIGVSALCLARKP